MQLGGLVDGQRERSYDGPAIVLGRCVLFVVQQPRRCPPEAPQIFVK
jgi:hypothetical protein